jgi:radical SAM protein with 4Fe4S-binding SPASM domain
MIEFCKVPELIHIEVTSKCNMKCPQCYNSNSGKDIDFFILFQSIKEAGSLGVKYIAISGGEPLLYPKIFSAIKMIRFYGMTSYMATGGMGLTVEMINHLVGSGLGCLYLSLNGSTKKIHEISRGSYDAAIKALMLLKETNLRYEINWVARNDNIEDFSKLVKMCTNCNAKAINVLILKPDIHNKINNSLNRDQICALANQIKSLQNSGFNINVEHCFSQLRYHLSWNNEDNMVGCRAGIDLMAINVEGEKLPCRHLQHLTNNTKGLMTYWENSNVLKRLRNIDESITKPCSTCFRFKKCRACRAVADKVYGTLESGDLDCPLFYPTCK